MLEDFDGIGRITDVPMTIVGKAALEAKNIGELLAWLKAKQKDVTYAHAGIGSASHLCALLFMSAIKVEMTAVSYRGTGPAMNDLVGGQFDMMCDQTTGTTNQIKEGKIKGYAATTAQRLKVLPELPTLDESGLKGFEVSAWHAMWAPKGIPAEASAKLVGRPADRAQGREGDRALRQPRHRAGGAEPGHAGSAQGAADRRARQVGAGDQGIGREGRELSLPVIPTLARSSEPGPSVKTVNGVFLDPGHSLCALPG